MDPVVHLRREQVRAAVTPAAGPRELRDREGLDGVDAQRREVGQTVDYVEERRDAVLAIGSVERADVKLIDDQVVERGRPETTVVPGKTGRVADDAVTDRIGRVQGELAGVWVALVPVVAEAMYVELVLVAIADAGDEPGPVAANILDQPLRLDRMPEVGAAETPVDVDVVGAWRPDPERSALRADEVGAERRLSVDVLLRCGHDSNPLPNRPVSRAANR